MSGTKDDIDAPLSRTDLARVYRECTGATQFDANAEYLMRSVERATVQALASASLGAVTQGAEAVAWSYEWYGERGDGPAGWHKCLGGDRPLVGADGQRYRNIRPLRYADEGAAQTSASCETSPGSTDGVCEEGWTSPKRVANSAGETPCAVRWMVETPSTLWLGAFDREAFEEFEAAVRAKDESHWRRLAMKFDAHRMKALWHLQAMLEDPAKHAEVARSFLGEAP